MFIVHLGKDIAADLSIFFSYMEEFGPGEVVIKIIVEVVVFWKAPKITVLHLMQVAKFGSSDSRHWIIKL